MAFLALDGTTIPAALGESTGEDEPVGKVERAFDGTARSSVRTYKDQWSVVTRWLTTSEDTTVMAALKGTPPLAATGDLTGSVSVVLAGPISRDFKKFADGERVRITFTIMEA